MFVVHELNFRESGGRFLYTFKPIGVKDLEVVVDEHLHIFF